MDSKNLVQGNTAFACDIYNKLSSTPGSFFFSPYSISSALAMTYAGARGETASQMAEVLHFPLDQEQLHTAFAALQSHLNGVQEKGAVQLHVANSLWPQEGYPFLPDFLTLVETNYGAKITPLNFADSETARQTINRWVEDKTNDKIKNLLHAGDVDALTRLILVNAIYFKGDWAWQFAEKETKEADFWLSPGESIQAPMMTQERSFGYAERDELQILEMPYRLGDLSMIVLLPKKVAGLANIENSLTAESLTDWTKRMRRRDVRVYLPRFKVNARFMLNTALGSLGMVDAFSARSADFSGMNGQQKDFYIGVVIHQAFVEVNEEGTEAAAATAVGMRTLSLPRPPVVFRADHPFLFLIRDNQSGSILFAGRMINPND